jgi:hypothetical protein
VPALQEEFDSPAHFKYVLPDLEANRALAVLRRIDCLFRVPGKLRLPSACQAAMPAFSSKFLRTALIFINNLLMHF